MFLSRDQERALANIMAKRLGAPGDVMRLRDAVSGRDEPVARKTLRTVR